MCIRDRFMGDTINAAGIASIHTAFNIITTVVLLPFGNILEKLAIRTIKEKQIPVSEAEKDLQMLDERFLDSPGYAIMQCKNAATKMANLAKIAVGKSIELIEYFDENTADRVIEIEDEVDRFEDKLGTYLVKISGKNLTIEEGHTVSMLLHSLNDFERISDHAVNILAVSYTHLDVYKRQIISLLPLSAMDLRYLLLPMFLRAEKQLLILQ